MEHFVCWDVVSVLMCGAKILSPLQIGLLSIYTKAFFFFVERYLFIK